MLILNMKPTGHLWIKSSLFVAINYDCMLGAMYGESQANTAPVTLSLDVLGAHGISRAMRTTAETEVTDYVPLFPMPFILSASR